MQKFAKEILKLPNIAFKQLPTSGNLNFNQKDNQESDKSDQSKISNTNKEAQKTTSDGFNNIHWVGVHFAKDLPDKDKYQYKECKKKLYNFTEPINSQTL